MATNTSACKLNHSMIRVKDPKVSIKFYEYLGLKLIKKLEVPSNNFDLYFLAFDRTGQADPSHGWHFTNREGVLELTHNYGTESDPNFRIANGNSDPGKGFGHICISVDNLQAACQRIEDAGYKFQKQLTDGKMKNIAFALDPDGYWIEVIGRKSLAKTAEVKETNPETYLFNHTMIRVKDAEKSLDFYRTIMGMSLVHTMEMKDSGFNLYFLGFPNGRPSVEIDSEEDVIKVAGQEGLLELTWIYGTEKDSKVKYHDGNSDPQGFGHICVSVDDLDAACHRFDERGVRWKKRLTEGRMRNIAFILDPDGYWIEIIQNEQLKHSSET